MPTRPGSAARIRFWEALQDGPEQIVERDQSLVAYDGGAVVLFGEVLHDCADGVQGGVWGFKIGAEEAAVSTQKVFHLCNVAAKARPVARVRIFTYPLSNTRSKMMLFEDQFLERFRDCDLNRYFALIYRLQAQASEHLR